MVRVTVSRPTLGLKVTAEASAPGRSDAAGPANQTMTKALTESRCRKIYEPSCADFPDKAAMGL